MRDPVRVSPTVRDIAAVIEEARQTVPDLRVRFRTDCRGKAWLVDICCSTVYVSSRLRFDEALSAITEGVAALVRNADIDASLIPAQRKGDMTECA